MRVRIKGGSTAIVTIKDKDFDEKKHEKFVKVTHKGSGITEEISERMLNPRIHKLVKEQKKTGTTKEKKNVGTTK
jgi:hypothetical protein